MDDNKSHARFVKEKNDGKIQEQSDGNATLSYDEVTNFTTTSDDSDSESDYPLAQIVRLRQQVEKCREIRKSGKQSASFRDEDRMPAPIDSAQNPADEPSTPSKRASACAARAFINDIYSSDEDHDNSDNDPDYVYEKEKARDSSSDNEVREFVFVRDSTFHSQHPHSSNTQTLEPDIIHCEQSAANFNDDKNNPDGEKESAITRKRHSNANLWKKNVRKNKRARGMEYTDTTGNQRQERQPRANGCELKNCRYKCHEHFLEQDRHDICRKYWSLADYSRQKDYILATTKTTQIQRGRSRQENPRNRENTVHYFFNIGAANFRVCKDFYLKTLDISAGPLKSAMKQRSDVNTFQGEDMRGKHEPHNTTSQEGIDFVKKHIEQFPQMEAHYVRKSSKRKYLDQTLSINKMYDLYKTACQQDGTHPVSQMTYRRIFCDNYNLAFFKPKKDQCAKCARWKTLTPAEKVDEKMEYDAHLKRHEEAQAAKKQDKIKAQNYPTFVSVSRVLNVRRIRRWR